MSTGGRYHQRHFDELEVGLEYIADFSSARVQITSREPSGLFLGDNGVYYTKTGRVTLNKKWNCFDDRRQYSEDLVAPYPDYLK